MPASITENSATLSRLDEPRSRTPADPRPLDDRRDADDATRLAPEVRAGDTPSDALSPAAATSSSGWLTSSDAIDHGRFEPGTLLGGRYRIVERLGRGGMGEVYRADDLKLGQAVALKFLPPDVDRDPARLMQIHTEVRMARQVSHPNVCRVYDVDEIDGHTFLSMEFVDGEELASLLRRFGRFSPDRALELARQLCAGLAAAHERGVVHRDLKPANVMLDGAGQVRITDFGLAGAAGEALRAGTPAYMAPEQIAGGRVTRQSDIYALGLVLYELFTGRRAFDAKSMPELLRQRDEGPPPPAQLVRELDPAIDRAILRCLEPDPADRPSSALGVAAALPGGDPLAAALAAGETPSPEMVAASGSTSALAPLPAFSCLAVSLIGLVALAALSDRTLLTSYVPIDKPPAVLAERAREIARTLGYPEAPADWAWGFHSVEEYLRFSRERSDGAATRERLRAGQPAGLLFWLRTSPRSMVPIGTEEHVTLDNPPLTVSGMRSITIDTDGRLLHFHAVPPQLEGDVASPAKTDWNTLFVLAGLDASRFTPAEARWLPHSFGDERAAWEGALPGWPQHRLRLEAAAYRGRPVYFQSIWPWTRPDRMQEEPVSLSQLWRTRVVSGMLIGVLGLAALVARHHARKGRGDRRGAVRLASVVFGCAMIAWLTGSRHFADVGEELDRFFTAIGEALFTAGLLWVLYLALEPYVRKLWPGTLVGWSRLLAGGFRDPRVGRDVLLGALFGIVIVVLGNVDHLMRPALGFPQLQPRVPNVSLLEGVDRVVTVLLQLVFGSVFNSLWIVFSFVAINLIVRRAWITTILVGAFLMLTSLPSITEAPPAWLGALFSLFVVSAILFIVFRFGLLATITMFFVNFVLSMAVLTLDTTRWFFPAAAATMLVVAVLVAYGFYASRGGEPLLGRRLLD